MLRNRKKPAIRTENKLAPGASSRLNQTWISNSKSIITTDLAAARITQFRFLLESTPEELRVGRSQPALIVFTSTPTLLTSISTVSPGFIHTGGLRRAPTPPGVPVTMTSPGSRVVNAEM